MIRLIRSACIFFAIGFVIAGCNKQAATETAPGDAQGGPPAKAKNGGHVPGGGVPSEGKG